MGTLIRMLDREEPAAPGDWMLNPSEAGDDDTQDCE